MPRGDKQIKLTLIEDERKKVKDKVKSPRKYNAMKSYQIKKTGFTLVEIMVVVVILGLAMWAAVPMFSGAAGMQAQAAANMLAADLEYAKSMAISHQKYYGVIFDVANDTYQVVECNSVSRQDDIQWHPVKKGFRYVINFQSDSRLNKVDLSTADFDSTSKIYFDYMGSPFNGSGTPASSPAAPMNSGTIILQGGGVTMTVTVEPVTGYIRIQ